VTPLQGVLLLAWGVLLAVGLIAIIYGYLTRNP